ncbi:MAG: 3-oxoadipate--succinyl-CoA transferase subunit B [Deltaproteobacteria bacterium]|nr:3-oxoadipate--succinyl-CoA transferase subunit B [Deltaproteobacteria bacterium]
MTNPNYNTAELVCIMSARFLEDGKIVFGGAGMPLISCILAQKIHAPRLTILFEGGVIGPHVEIGKMPPSTNEQRAARRANMLLSITDILLLQQRGYVDYGFLGGAQIDQYGNLNSSFIGDADNPKVRLPGTGGANDIASLASKILVAMHHEKKRFVEKVDFITTPGYLRGGDSREKAGMTVGGTYKVITHLGIFGFDEESRRMRLETLHPGGTIEEVKGRTGFELLIPKEIQYTKPPTEKELRTLRELDPDQRYTRPKEE